MTFKAMDESGDLQNFQAVAVRSGELDPTQQVFRPALEPQQILEPFRVDETRFLKVDHEIRNLRLGDAVFGGSAKCRAGVTGQVAVDA